MTIKDNPPVEPPAENKRDNVTNNGDEFMIPEGSLWGTQTQRSLHYFRIGNHLFSNRFIKALVSIKRACAQSNRNAERLDRKFYEAIELSCDAILEGQYSDQFPLSIWQTGSGTQTNMNVNEVISSIANALLNKKENAHLIIHPNDHVNMSQSSNDIFPSAMHIVVAQLTHEKLLSAMDQLNAELAQKQETFNTVYAVGRTHLMDAVPLTVGAMLSAFRAQLGDAKTAILESLGGVYQLAIGGTAVGTGCNAPPDFGKNVSDYLSIQYGLPFTPHTNLFAAVSGQDALLRYSASLKQLASVLFKIANDFRLLGSGPHCGLNEWHLPANEAGSSIMPGKVNPTQCEALSMVCLQVFGNDLTTSLAASHGQLQLNTYRPVIIHNILESINILADAMKSFTQHCVNGLTLNETQINKNMQRNLSAITILAPKLGYDVAAKIVHKADQMDISLGQAAEDLGLYSAADFDALLNNELKGSESDITRKN